MSQFKLTCLLYTTMILYLLYHTCNIEGLENKIIKNCNDDPTWFVEDRSGSKNYCHHIGKSASCYDIDASGREGWERCLKSCGNCANTQVTKLPMNFLATYSGDPIEDFGVVLHIDKDRQWVGKTASKDKKDDIRGYIDSDKSEDIDDLYSRMTDVEGIFDIMTGNIKKCKQPTKCKDKTFAGCDNQCLKCPTATPTGTRNYVKQTCESNDDDADCSIQFPAYSFQCKDLIPTGTKPPKIFDSTIQTQVKNQGDYSYMGCFNESIVAREMTDLDQSKNPPSIHKDHLESCKGVKGWKKWISTGKNVEDCLIITGDKESKLSQCATICSKSESEYMGIQYGNQCWCSKNIKGFFNAGQAGKKGLDNCGFGGSKCFNEGGSPRTCQNHNAVFRIINPPTDRPTTTDKSEICKKYFLFDKVIENDKKDKSISKPTDQHKISLYDMCPVECGANSNKCEYAKKK